MLVIRRRPGESIRVGEDVEIEIIECGPHRVKLGVRAPKEVPVWRTETQAAREQNLQAAAWQSQQALASLARHRNWAASEGSDPAGSRNFPVQGFSERSDTGN